MDACPSGVESAWNESGTGLSWYWWWRGRVRSRGHAAPCGLSEPALGSDGSRGLVAAAGNKATDLRVVRSLYAQHRRQPLAKHRGAAGLKRMAGRRAAARQPITGFFAVRCVGVVLCNGSQIHFTIWGGHGGVAVIVPQSFMRVSSGRLMAVPGRDSRARHGDREDRHAYRKQRHNDRLHRAQTGELLLNQRSYLTKGQPWTRRCGAAPSRRR